MNITRARKTATHVKKAKRKSEFSTIDTMRPKNTKMR
jgi:hypothetical protein